MGNYIPIIVMSKGDFEHRHQQNQIPYTDSLRLVLPQVREIENQRELKLVCEVMLKLDLDKKVENLVSDFFESPYIQEF